MDGLTVEDFMTLCDYLYNSISKRTELVNTNYDPQELLFAEMNILSAASEIIDQSHGSIKSDNDELKISFREVFEIARNLKSRDYQVKHLEAEIETAKKANNQEDLERATKSRDLNKKLLINSYKDALVAITKAKNARIGMHI